MIRRGPSLAALLDARRAPFALQVLTGVVVLSVGFAAAALVWRVSGFNDGRDQVALAPAATGPAVVSDVAPILALSPFGGADAGVQAVASGLILKAVFMAYPASASSAVIAVGDAPAVPVYIGQALASGAVVQAIGMDHVVLQVGANSERLDFPKAPGAAGQTAPVASTPVPGLAGVTPPASSPTPTASGPTTNSSGMTPSVVEQYRQKLAGNPQAVASNMGLTATGAGYRVGDSLPAELRAAGLQPGDVVEKVNNQPVGSASDARGVLDQAITSGGARVEVLRNGRRLTLSFPLR